MTGSAAPFATEASLHAAVSAFLARLGIKHTNQYPVGPGYADVCLHLADGRPWCLLELKKELDPAALQLADAADFFEQALKYRLESGLPVFVGPFFHQSMGVISGFLSGGHQPKTTAALSALAGRADVGLFFLHAIRGFEARQIGWYGIQLLLRQNRVASHHTNDVDFKETVWPSEPLRLIDFCSPGSRKDRK